MGTIEQRNEDRKMKAAYKAADDYREGNSTRLIDIIFSESEREAAEQVAQYLVDEFAYTWIVEEDDMFTLGSDGISMIDEMKKHYKQAKKAAH